MDHASIQQHLSVDNYPFSLLFMLLFPQLLKKLDNILLNICTKKQFLIIHSSILDAIIYSFSSQKMLPFYHYICLHIFLRDKKDRFNMNKKLEHDRKDHTDKH